MTVPSRIRLHLAPAAAAAIRRGHPWVYADRIQAQNRAGQSGDLAVLYDRHDRFIALGLYETVREFLPAEWQSGTTR